VEQLVVEGAFDLRDAAPLCYKPAGLCCLQRCKSLLLEPEDFGVYGWLFFITNLTNLGAIFREGIRCVLKFYDDLYCKFL